MGVKSIASDLRMIGPPIDSRIPAHPVDGASSGHADYVAPTGLYIRGVNIAVAGDLTLLHADGVTSGLEYFNTGWQPCSLAIKILDSASNTATVRKVATTATSVRV